MQPMRPPACPALLIDIEREREHWRQRYPGLPRARAMRSFARYWPVLCAAYDVYLNHPHAGRGQTLDMFLQRADVAGSPLSGEEAGEVFGRVRERIDRLGREREPG